MPHSRTYENDVVLFKTSFEDLSYSLIVPRTARHHAEMPGTGGEKRNERKRYRYGQHSGPDQTPCSGSDYNQEKRREDQKCAARHHRFENICKKNHQKGKQDGEENQRR